MKIKAVLKYLIYLSVLIILIVLRDYIENLYSELYYRFDTQKAFFYEVISVLLGISIGIFLGIEQLIKEIGKEGTWKINLPKLILVGLPALYFSLGKILIMSGYQYINEMIAYPLLYLLRYGWGFVALLQVVFGYIVITSFLKYSDLN
ncbi:MAG: hypothetical protein K0S47_2137 [Herbinix sp.]|jgi:hypothetical protein|nr:hypothetical protein [Herbinix sp.]